MTNIDDQELAELRRKAALYDEAMKQEPVAMVLFHQPNCIGWNPGLSALPNDRSPLYLRPIPPPDVRELVEALQDLCATLGECGMTEKARAALAKWEGKV